MVQWIVRFLPDVGDQEREPHGKGVDAFDVALLQDRVLANQLNHFLDLNKPLTEGTELAEDVHLRHFKVPACFGGPFFGVLEAILIELEEVVASLKSFHQLIQGNLPH